MMDSPVDGRDVALGLAVTGARAALAAGRLALKPLRVARRSSLLGDPVRRLENELDQTGQVARQQARGRLESAAARLLSEPEIERIVDRVLAGPLIETVTRSLVRQRVAERAAVQLLTGARPDDLLAPVEGQKGGELVQLPVARPRLEDLVRRVLDSPAMVEATDEVLRSEEMQRVIGHIAESPEIRQALTRQSMTVAGELGAGLRSRSESLDDAAERTVRGWLRRPPRDP